MIHTPIVDENELLLDGAHADLKNNVALLRIFVYGSDIAMDADPNKSQKKNKSSLPGNKQSRRIDAGTATKAMISSCVNTPCEILGVIRSPAFLVGSSRSLRNINKKSRDTEAAAQTASVAASVAAHVAAQAAAHAAAQALAMPMGIPGHGMFSLSRPPANAPVNMTNDHMAMYDQSTGARLTSFDEMLAPSSVSSSDGGGTNGTASTSPRNTPSALDDHSAPSTEYSNEPVKKKARLGGHQDHPDPIMMEEQDFTCSLSTMGAKSNVPGLPKTIEENSYYYQKICASDASSVKTQAGSTTARSLPTHPAHPLPERSGPQMFPTIPLSVS
jgi:hypothetical protein